MRIIPGLGGWQTCKYWSVVPDQHCPTAQQAQLVARLLAVRQARVRFSARLHREVNPNEFTSDEEMEERGPANECD
jgi:hypothetical protein